MAKSRNRKKKKKKPIDYSSQKNRKTDLEKNTSILRKRVAKSPHGSNVKIDKFEHSVSGLILDFGKDYLDTCKTDDDYRKTLVLLIMGWNLGNLSEDLREKAITDMLSQFDVPEAGEVLRHLINLKMSFYDEYKYIVTDHEIGFGSNGDLNFSVTSTIIPPDEGQA